MTSAPAGSTTVRGLNSEEIDLARQFLRDTGGLSGFLETFDD
jgi:hypothetical protein